MDGQPAATEPAPLAVETFLALLTNLLPEDWDQVMARAAELGVGLGRDEVIRGAVVAIAVRGLLSPSQFNLLYMPFADAIPTASLHLAPGHQN